MSNAMQKKQTTGIASTTSKALRVETSICGNFTMPMGSVSVITISMEIIYTKMEAPMPEKLICDYCGKVRTSVAFFIGASLTPDWTKWEGTAKVSCDSEVCFLAGREESAKAVDAHVKSLSKAIVLSVETYLKAFKTYPSHKEITDGKIGDFLANSEVKYYGGKCPVYYVEHYHPATKERCVIGGNYATNGKPHLREGEPLDFN